LSTKQKKQTQNKPQVPWCGAKRLVDKERLVKKKESMWCKSCPKQPMYAETTYPAEKRPAIRKREKSYLPPGEGVAKRRHPTSTEPRFGGREVEKRNTNEKKKMIPCNVRECGQIGRQPLNRTGTSSVTAQRTGGPGKKKNEVPGEHH